MLTVRVHSGPRQGLEQPTEARMRSKGGLENDGIDEQIEKSGTRYKRGHYTTSFRRYRNCNPVTPCAMQYNRDIVTAVLS